MEVCMNKMVRQTLDIMDTGYYDVNGIHVDIKDLQETAVKESFLLTPKQGEELLNKSEEIVKMVSKKKTIYSVWNCSTVEAILQMYKKGKDVGVLNFASAKNPGGGFINGAMAQEESLAVSSCLYKTQLAHEEYYTKNRSCKTMMYTDYAIYSPNVVFFRDGHFGLLEKPVAASVLTLPAVNMGQVMLKGENVSKAENVMKNRMKLSLAIFANQGCKHLILGAYGCGVFRNDPMKIAQWWSELLQQDFAGVFENVVFAVLDKSSTGKCIKAFQMIFGS